MSRQAQPMIDAKGRCCGRKPLHYKTGTRTMDSRPQLYCPRCNASYNPVTLEQRDNWAWTQDVTGKFVRRGRHVTVVR